MPTLSGFLSARQRAAACALVAFAGVAVMASAARAQILFVASQPYCNTRACVETRGLWLMNDNGSNAHLWLAQGRVPLGTAGLESPSISPDGRTVVFSGRVADGMIWSTGIYKWQPSKVTRLSPTPRPGGTSTLSVQTVDARDPEIGPAGQVYYARQWHVLGSKYTGDHAQIWRQSLSDVGGQGVNMNVCQMPDIGFGTPDDTNIGDPSPNPQWAGSFTYSGCYQVTAPFRDTTLLRIKDPQNGEFTAFQDSDGYTLSDPSWSPDGAQIAFVRDHGTTAGPHELRLAFWDGHTWKQRLIYTGVNAISSPRFAGNRIIFTESNRFPDGNPCTDCGEGIRSIPASCSSCTESRSTLLVQAHNGDMFDPAWTSATLPYHALPTPDGVGVLRGQTLRGALSKGLKLLVSCQRSCMAGASMSINGSLARKLRLLSRTSKAKTFQVASGSLRSGTGSRTMTVRFTTRSQKALRSLKDVKLALVVRCLSSGHLTTYTGTVTLRR